MKHLLILVDGPAQTEGQELEADLVLEQIQPRLSQSFASVEVMTTQARLDVLTLSQSDFLIYPLTFNLPAPFQSSLFASCQAIAGLQQQVQQWGYATGSGSFWLPIVLTAKGPLYGEAIGAVADPGSISAVKENSYVQPVHLADQWRQPLYQLAFRLLHTLKATPATYLLQFGWQQDQVWFDRLWPFPVKAALASLGVQSPDLFECHGRCLAGLPITDLYISATAPYRLLV